MSDDTHEKPCGGCHREVLVTIFLEEAEVQLQIHVRLYSDYTEEDLHKIVNKLFPHLEEYHIFAELKGEK